MDNILASLKFDRNWFLGFLLFLAILFAYQPSWDGGPVWDDDAHMTKPQLQSVGGLLRIWVEPGAAPQYYPLVHSIFWLQHRLFGDKPLTYHLFNIVLHFISALLLVSIIRILGISGGWLAGAIFALHPVMVESVAWITELKNTLSCVFYLCTVFVYLKFDEKRNKKHYIVALLLFLIGLLAKSVIVVLPAILIIVFWWKRGRIDLKSDIIPLLPFFTIGLLSGLFTAWVERRFVGAIGSDFNFTFIERCLIAGRVIWFYLFKILWPVNLIFIYPHWDIDSKVMWQFCFPVAYMLILLLLWGLRKRSRAPLATLLYFTIALFPALGFINVYPFRFSFVADHFQYLAAIGPIVFASAGVASGINRIEKKYSLVFKSAGSVVLLTILFLLSWRQSSLYRNATTLYRDTIKKNENCWLAYNNLGLIYAKQGRTDEAMTCYQKALSIRQNIEQTNCNIGNLLKDLGRYNEAISYYRKALEIKPDYTDAHNNLALLLTQKGQTSDAIDHLQKAVQANPDDARYYNNMGILLANKGQTVEAIDQFRKALALDPKDINILENLVFALLQEGKLNDIVYILEKSLASANVAGDTARIEDIGKIYDKVNQIINVSK